MTKTIGIYMWAALLAAAPGARAQDAPPKPPEESKAPGKRLLVRFQETRLRGESTTATRPYTVALHADAGSAHVFVGLQVPITVFEKDGPSNLVKSAGVDAQVSVATLLDGRYRLDAKFEEDSLLATGAGTEATTAGGNPILRAVKGQSTVTLREGETVPFASAVDPVTGDVVRVDLTVTAAPAAKLAKAAEHDETQLRAQVVLVRRLGETRIARRPYAVVLPTGGEEAAEVFSGSMLPLQIRMNGQLNVVFKEIGAGIRLKAHRVPDGRYRLDVEFSDGVMAPGKDLPQMRMFESKSQLFVQEGEVVTIASAVDPQTGEVVEAQVSVEGVR
jgi:hypothetical protein